MNKEYGFWYTCSIMESIKTASQEAIKNGHNFSEWNVPRFEEWVKNVRNVVVSRQDEEETSYYPSLESLLQSLEEAVDDLAKAPEKENASQLKIASEKAEELYDALHDGPSEGF